MCLKKKEKTLYTPESSHLYVRVTYHTHTHTHTQVRVITLPKYIKIRAI